MKQEGLYPSLDEAWKRYLLRPQAEKRGKKHFQQRTSGFSNMQMYQYESFQLFYQKVALKPSIQVAC